MYDFNLANNLRPQTYVSEHPRVDVLWQEGPYIWIAGNYWTPSQERKGHAQIVVKDSPYTTNFTDNTIAFKIGMINQPTLFNITDHTEDNWNPDYYGIEYAGQGYYLGQTVYLTALNTELDLPNINFVITEIDDKGGVKSFKPTSVKEFPLPADGTYTLASSKPIQKQDSIKGMQSPSQSYVDSANNVMPTSTDISYPAKVSIDYKGNIAKDGDKKYQIATRILLGDSNGKDSSTPLLDNDGAYKRIPLKLTPNFYDFMSEKKDIFLVGLTEPSDSFKAFPNQNILL